MPLAGRSLIERQARLAGQAGASPVVILVERVPAELAAVIERLRSEGIAAVIARSVADAAQAVPPGDRLLVLADGLAWARLELGATVLVDVATLTGAMKVALGTRTAGLYATSDGLADALRTAAGHAGEPVWRMPLAEEHADLLDSTVADANNAPGNPGGTTAALFLRPFAGDLPWAHLDVAGPARAGSDDAEVVKGGTGFGARTLLRWLEAGAPVDAPVVVDR